MNNSDTGVVVVYCTAPPHESEAMAHTLLQEGLVACVNLVPVQSVYRWEGAVYDEAEVLMVIKTRTDVVDELTEKIQQIHPYKQPEVIVLPVTGGSKDYLQWVINEIPKKK